MSRRLLTVLSTLLVAVVSASAAAGDGGPSPGVTSGGAGIATRDGRVHYVTVPTSDGTVVEAIDRHGAVLRFSWLVGSLGVPLVASDGTTGGLSRDGKRLVLASYAQPSFTEFAVLDTRTFVPVKTITLKGYWSYDALSPDRRTLYLIQYFLGPTHQRYLVRAYDLVHGRLYKQAVVARTERGKMTGYPLTRTTTADGVWAFTLYVKGDGSAFVHALDTSRRKAVCVDLPWSRGNRLYAPARLRLSGNGRLLYVRPHEGKRATIDTRSWKVIT